MSMLCQTCPLYEDPVGRSCKWKEQLVSDLYSALIPDRVQVEDALRAVYEKGIRSLAVVLLHSYTFVDHEQTIGDIATRLGFTHVSLSGKVSPMIRLVPRAHSATADAYLTPQLQQYLNG